MYKASIPKLDKDATWFHEAACILGQTPPWWSISIGCCSHAAEVNHFQDSLQQKSI